MGSSPDSFQTMVQLYGFFSGLAATFILVPFVAVSKGRTGFGWFFTGLFLSPLLALIALAALPDLSSSQTT